MATPQQQTSMPGLSGQGPLQAFGHMQRALRDADKRLDALGQSQLQVATAVDGKLNKTVRRMQEDSAALRKETHDLLAELEQLTLQMYEVTRTRTRTRTRTLTLTLTLTLTRTRTQSLSLSLTPDPDEEHEAALTACREAQVNPTPSPNPIPNTGPSPNPNPDPRGAGGAAERG